MLKKAEEIFLKEGKVSSVYLARRLKITLVYAKKLIDRIEAEKTQKTHHNSYYQT